METMTVDQAYAVMVMIAIVWGLAARIVGMWQGWRQWWNEGEGDDYLWPDSHQD